MRVNANFLSGTATIAYDETRVTPANIETFVAECGYHCRGEVMPAHVCEPGKPNGKPAGRAMEHQGHAPFGFSKDVLMFLLATPAVFYGG